MGEREIFGMKVKTVGMETVEIIAHNRHSQAVFMCTMHAQLVGAAGMGCEHNAVIRSFMSDNFLICHRRFPFFVIHHVSWTVQIIGSQRQ